MAGYRADIIQDLINHGADISAKGTTITFSPLFIAVLFGDKNAVSILLQAGAMPNEIDQNNGETPLITSISRYFMAIQLRIAANMYGNTNNIDSTDTLKEIIKLLIR